MTKSEQKFANILGKLVITTRERDSMEVGCVGICVAVAPSLANKTYNVIVKHIDFVKYGERCAILHSVFAISGSSKFIWANGEKVYECKDWFYAYNINDLSLLTNKLNSFLRTAIHFPSEIETINPFPSESELNNILQISQPAHFSKISISNIFTKI